MQCANLLVAHIVTKNKNQLYHDTVSHHDYTAFRYRYSVSAVSHITKFAIVYGLITVDHMKMLGTQLCYSLKTFHIEIIHELSLIRENCVLQNNYTVML